MQTPKPNRSTYTISLAGLVAVVLLYWFCTMWLDRSTVMSNALHDIYRMYLPNLYYYFDSIQQGIFPLWNPYEFIGMPFVAILEFGPFYPLTLLYALFPMGDAHLISTGLHLLIITVGIFQFCVRSLRLHPVASALGACTIVASGWANIHGLLAIDSFRSMAYVPWILLAVDAIITKPTARSAAILAMLLSLQFLAGEAEVSVRTGILMGVFLLFQLATRSKSFENASKHIQLVAISIVSGGLLALGIAAVQWIPTLEATAHSVRPTGSLTFAQTQMEGLESYSNLLTRFTTEGDYFNIFFIGMPLLLLALYSLRFRNRYTLIFGILAVLLASLMLGSTSWVARFYYLLPTGDWFRWPFRYLPFFLCTLSILVAIGAHNVIRDWQSPVGSEKETSRPRWIPLLFPTLLIIGLFAWDIVTPAAETAFYLIPMIAMWIAAFAIIMVKPNRNWFAIPLLLFTATILIVPGYRFPTSRLTPPSHPDLVGVPQDILNRPEFVEATQHRNYVDFSTVDGRRVPKFGPLTRAPSINGFSVFMPASFWEQVEPHRLDRLQSEQADVPTGLWGGLSLDHGANDVFDIMGVRYVLLGLGQELVPEDSQPDSITKIAEFPPYTLWENPDPWPRAFLISPGSPTESIDELNAQRVAKSTPVTLTRILPNSVSLQLPPQSKDQLLVLTDQAYPGWRVHVDGETREILTIAGLFRGVIVKAGDSHVKFTYRPLSFQLGATISLISLLIWLIAVSSIIPRMRRKRDKNTPVKV